MGKEDEPPMGAKGFISQGLWDEISRKQGSIEATGRLWARRNKEKMKSGGEDPVYVIRLTPEYENIRKLFREGHTLGGRKDASDVAYDHNGNMWITTWPDAQTAIDPKTGKRFLVKTQDYEYKIANPKKVRKKDVNDLPLDREIVEIVFSSTDVLEKGFRLPGHVINSAMERELHQARTIVKASNSLANTFLTGKVTREDLEILARRLGDYLEETGIFRPKDEDKANMVEMLLRATQPDSLGRVNPLVSRIRIRSSYLSASKRMIVQGFVVAKFEKIGGILAYERETTRWAMENVIDQARTYVLGVSIMQGGAITGTQKAGVFDVLHSLYEELYGNVRVKPYLAPGRLAASKLIEAGDKVLLAKDIEEIENAKGLVEDAISIQQKVLVDYADIKTAGKA